MIGTRTLLVSLAAVAATAVCAAPLPPGIVRDVSAVSVGDEAYRYTPVQNGSVFTIRDGSGRLVSRDTGLIQFVVVVDESTGDVLSQELGTVNGPHPGFCDRVLRLRTDLIGWRPPQDAPGDTAPTPPRVTLTDVGTGRHPGTEDSMTRKTNRLAVTAIAGAAVLALATPSANADVFDHFRFSFTQQETFDDCGFPIVDDQTGSGNTVTRTVKDTQTLFFASVTFHSEEVLTNPENGKWFRVTSNEITKEGGPVTEVAPGVYRYTVSENGNPITIWDAAGHKVVGDHGSIRSSITFDTGGDAVPGGNELERHIVSVSGPHPLLDDALFCQVANDLIG